MDQTADDGKPDYPADRFAPVLDVSGMSLTELTARGDDSALAQCLRRLADGSADPGEPIAGFNSAL